MAQTLASGLGPGLGRLLGPTPFPWAGALFAGFLVWNLTVLPFTVGPTSGEGFPWGCGPDEVVVGFTAEGGFWLATIVVGVVLWVFGGVAGSLLHGQEALYDPPSSRRRWRWRWGLLAAYVLAYAGALLLFAFLIAPAIWGEPKCVYP